MNLTEFLRKIFIAFPPSEKCDVAATLQLYKETLQTAVNYDYNKAFDEFVKLYKYRRLPSIGELTDALKPFVQKDNTVIEFRNVIAYKGKNRYDFAYNPADQCYTNVKRNLISQGFRVMDEEQEHGEKTRRATYGY